MKHPDIDVVVVGGGHAGTEAAAAAARRGARALLVTQRLDRIGEMSCNPAIGGIGKGHLVREIDALDGLMGHAADAAGIQFRLLNRSKGPAVQGPRTQADRQLYRSAVQALLRQQDGLTLLEGEVVDLRISNGRVTGVVLGDDTTVSCRAVILTTGTFLGGTIHIGEIRRPGGRMGDAPSSLLAQRLRALDLPLGRLKTGTPPRLDGRTIDWTRIERQEADADPVFLSFMTRFAPARQVACGITRTNAQTHRVISDNLSRSAMYGGHIAGVGPRYCPSIEDKVVRFPEKESHQIFLEPEGLETDTVYPNGISTSLPPDVQETYVRTIPGLEHARILQPGYAIEYDYVDPCSLSHGLALRALPGLFLAGQINGTTGYEEAAAQGLVAGLNAAALALGLEEFQPDRSSSYVGVLIDDLVTRGVTEPYRMFTSRAEFRLSLRADNADQRLTPRGLELGCVGPQRATAFAAKMDGLRCARELASSRPLTPAEIGTLGIPVNADGQRRSALDLLGQGRVAPSDLLRVWPELESLPADDLAQIARDALYSLYLERQERDIASLRRDEALRIPEGFDFSIPGLSAELQGKLRRVRPDSVGQAGRIEGMTPAALAVLAARLRTLSRKSA